MNKIKRTIKDFEFYYLTELTRQKIKPLSRWEQKLPEKTCRWLKHNGFSVERIPRKTLSGKDVVETIFSTSANYLDLYRRRFSHTLINKRAENQRFEGFLFGYPSCCVEQFIQHPYSANNLSRAEQSLLFHWACTDCRSTNDLIPYYQKVFNDVSEWYDHEFRKKSFSRHYQNPVYMAAAAILFGFGIASAQGPADSLHYIQLPGDLNKNGLSYAEEVYLGACEEYHMTHDCQLFAREFMNIIDSLPDTVQTNRPYLIDHSMRGVVPCPKCGLNVNMGYVSIINPLRNLQMDIPYMGLHFMEKGFFSYGSDEDYQRIDIDTLKKIIYPYDPEHCLPVEGDKDGDGLTDTEEDSIWMAYTAEHADFNNDGVPDGSGIAEELIRLFPRLKEQPDGMHSSIEFIPVWGSEICQICGSIQNMGSIEITNPENKRTYHMPFIGLHAMAHGSFAYNGTVHQNERIDVVELYRTMKTHMLFVNGDTDNDGLKDSEEKYFNFDSKKADSNNDGIPDGMELAIAFAGTIESLPAEPKEFEPWVEYLDMDGIHLCSVCGEEIPMGVMKIHNPAINSLPLEFSYYAFHFLRKGSFACEGAVDNRINPVLLSNYIGIPTVIHTDQQTSVPEHFELRQNYPNPFNLQTVIPYYLSKQSSVSLKIYNICGQELKILVDQVQASGSKSVSWDGTNMDNRSVNSGFYIYELTVNGVSRYRKMLLIK
jgi:hypothetical protein